MNHYHELGTINPVQGSNTYIITFPEIDMIVIITAIDLVVIIREAFNYHFRVQIAYSLIEEQEGKKRAYDDYISFVSLLADPRYCGTYYT